MHIVYVGSENDKVKAELNDAKILLGKISIACQITILNGDMAESLKDYVLKNNISLLSMGAFSHSWLRDMVIGSLTSKVIRIIKVPVLFIEPRESFFIGKVLMCLTRLSLLIGSSYDLIKLVNWVIKGDVF